MATHNDYQDLMVEALFDEIAPEDRRRLHAHLSTCDACASEFDALRTTLAFASRREQPEPPAAFWRDFDAKLAQRLPDAHRAPAPAPPPSVGQRLQQWGQRCAHALSAWVPHSGRQWALQGAVAVLMLALGIALNASSESPLPAAESLDLLPAAVEAGSPQLSALMLAQQSVESPLGTARPALAGVEDIAYNVSDGTVDIRYRTVNRITVKGAPDDPRIQRLLQAALLDDANPVSRLHAVKTLEDATMAPSDDLVQALTYLAQEEGQSHMRLRAVRALRALHQGQPMRDDVRNVLIRILLEGDSDPLRIEALQTLTAASSADDMPAYLYRIQNDPNSYVRYHAQERLQQAGATRAAPSLHR